MAWAAVVQASKALRWSAGQLGGGRGGVGGRAAAGGACWRRPDAIKCMQSRSTLRSHPSALHGRAVARGLVKDHSQRGRRLQKQRAYNEHMLSIICYQKPLMRPCDLSSCLPARERPELVPSDK